MFYAETKNMTFDVITYNGEKELFEIRYNTLKDFVDEFIVVEFDKTFSGKPKTCSFQDAKLHLLPKVKYCFNDLNIWLKYKELAESSPNTKGAEHWKLEFMQKESIKDCLTHLKDDDLVFIGDCDEIWNEFALSLKGVYKLRLKVYTYYLNNRSSEEFWGTLVAPYKKIKSECLNHLRTRAKKTYEDYGWHFTSMASDLKRKLEDSYTGDSYASLYVMEHLEDNIKNNRDFLGRNFTYWPEEGNWPKYLTDNRQKYKHLLK